MPIYEYACPDCGHKFELIQKFTDEPAKTCPQCEGANVKKLVSLSAFQLQGGGWYKDHYGLKSGADAAGAKATGGKGASSTAESKGGEGKGAEGKGGDTKPAAAASTPAPKSSPASSGGSTPAAS